MVRYYVPERGDLVWLQFSPQAGHEQSGLRPALVVSLTTYNEKTGAEIVLENRELLRGRGKRKKGKTAEGKTARGHSITESWKRGTLSSSPGRPARASRAWRNGSCPVCRSRNRHEGHGYLRSLGRLGRLRETWHSIPPRTNPRTTARHSRACRINRSSKPR